MSALGRHAALGDLLQGFADPGPARAVPVSGLNLDSRQLRRGEVFVALAGTQRHGLEFADAAAERGAAAIVYETPGPSARVPIPAIAVPELRGKLSAIAERWFGAPSRAMTVIGVTGTNGKTSTVQLLAQALSDQGSVTGTIGTLGAGLHGRLQAGERTTPDAINTQRLLAEMRDESATHVAMEVSSHALDQARVEAVRFDTAVFTNLTHDHLDYHGTMARYFAAKARLFDWPELRVAVINRDDPYGRELMERLPPSVRLIDFSLDDARATVFARDIRTSAAGLSFTLQAPEGAVDVHSVLLGRFNVANLLAVAATLIGQGWPLVRVREALDRLQPVTGRMNRLGGVQGAPLVVVDYAHTPDALEQALANARAHTRGRLICVFGCGGDRDAAKRPIMGGIAERLADATIVTDDNPRSENGDTIVAQILSGYRDANTARVIRDRGQAIAAAIARARADDTVLIAGKGHETYQESGGQRRHFDDLAEAARALENHP